MNVINKITVFLFFILISLDGKTQDFSKYIDDIDIGLKNIYVTPDIKPSENGIIYAEYNQDQFPYSFLVLEKGLDSYRYIALAIDKTEYSSTEIKNSIENIDNISLVEVENFSSNNQLFVIEKGNSVIGSLNIYDENDTYVIHFMEFKVDEFVKSFEKISSGINENGIESYKGSMNDENTFHSNFNFYGAAKTYFIDIGNKKGFSGRFAPLDNLFFQTAFGEHLKAFQKAGFHVVEDKEFRHSSDTFAKKYLVHKDGLYMYILLKTIPEIIFIQTSKSVFDKFAKPKNRTEWNANDEKSDLYHPSTAPFTAFSGKYEGDNLLTLIGRHKDDPAIRDWINQPGFKNIGKSFEEANGDLVIYKNENQFIDIRFRDNRVYSIEIYVKYNNLQLPFGISDTNSLLYNEEVEFKNIDHFEKDDGDYEFKISKSHKLIFQVYEGELVLLKIY